MTKQNNLASLEEYRKHFEQVREKPVAPLKSGGGGGNYGDMEARLTKLETIAEDTRKSLESIQRHIARIDAKLTEMPSKQFVFGAICSIYGLMIATAAVAVAAMSAF